jgi:NTP pyrophosphatase (non-canonical NTP hydrolase)
MSLTNLVSQVEDWSKNKGLDQADSRGQFLKVVEEVGEVAAAMARSDMAELKDGIGDVVVTLVILAQQHGLTLEECLAAAYGEIAGRTGKMVNGVFVKSEDLASTD